MDYDISPPSSATAAAEAGVQKLSVLVTPEEIELATAAIADCEAAEAPPELLLHVCKRCMQAVDLDPEQRAACAAQMYRKMHAEVARKHSPSDNGVALDMMFARFAPFTRTQAHIFVDILTAAAAQQQQQDLDLSTTTKECEAQQQPPPAVPRKRRLCCCCCYCC